MFVQVLLPAIILHGTFDFVLFLMGTLQFAYNLHGLEIASFVVAAIITIAGAMYAYYKFNKVTDYVTEYNV
jgi:hypothetical protein